MITLKTKTVADLNAVEYGLCYKYNRGSKGRMRRALRLLRKHRDTEASVVMAWDRNKFAGWAFLFYVDNEPVIHVYVLSSYRQRGIGTKLLKSITDQTKEVPTAYPLTSIGEKLFNKVDSIKVQRR